MIENMHKILIVDDSPSALALLNTLLSKEKTYRIYKAADAEEGLRIAKDVIPDIIISDYYMPGKNGLEFCQEIRKDKELSNAIFILLTSETDIVKKIEGLEGGVDDYIEKTISTKVLLSKVKIFLKIKFLQNELLREKQNLQIANVQLENNINELIAVLLKILEIQIPGAGKRSNEAANIAAYISKMYELDAEKTKNILFAAKLHEIGKIGLPEKINKSDLKNLESRDAEIYRQFPVIGSLILSTFTGYADAANYVCHQLENYDGSGTPDGLTKEEIGIGARILRTIVFQEELFMMGFSVQEVIDKIRSAIGTKLDPFISAYLIDYLKGSAAHHAAETKKVTVEDLKAGMKLEDDIYSASGVKILPKGVVLKERMIEIIRERNIVDPIIGGITVNNP